MRHFVTLFVFMSLSAVMVTCNQGNANQSKTEGEIKNISKVEKAGDPGKVNVKVGELAPDFTLTDYKGVEHKLSDYKGNYVVLEWVNYGCPYVKKHYESHNMQNIQKELTSKGNVIWLSICSSAEGKQGYFDTAAIEAKSKELGTSYTAYLVDKEGTVGKTYSARTTPHMYIVDPEGKLIYMGAIDDKPTSDKADVQGAKNFVKAAYSEAASGKDITVSYTESYGCSVKYKN